MCWQHRVQGWCRVTEVVIATATSNPDVSGCADTPPSEGAWFVYLLECENGRLYTGITTDLTARFAAHCAGKGAMFTRLNAPRGMLAAQVCSDRSSASRLEWATKQGTPAQKRTAAASWSLQSGLPRRG